MHDGEQLNIMYTKFLIRGFMINYIIKKYDS